MFKKKNHVGRPSNEELRKRRNKKIILILIPAIAVVLLLILITTGSLSILSGNSVTSYYCDEGYELGNDSKCHRNIKEKAYYIGDVNMDYVIDEKDDISMQNYFNKKEEFDEFQKELADVNKDGLFNETDEIILKKHIDNSNVGSNAITNYIGDKTCKKDYSLENDECVKVETIDAKIKTNSESSNVVSDENIYGDVNLDGVVNAKDRILLTGYIVNKNVELNDRQKLVSDVNLDGQVDNNDLEILTNYLAKKSGYETLPYKSISNNETVNDNGGNNGNVESNNKSDNNKKVSESGETNESDIKNDKTVNTTESVNVTFKPQDNKTVVPLDTKYKMNVVFDIKDKENTYYYMWANYKDGKRINYTPCAKVVQGEHNGSFTVDGLRKVAVSIYSDSNCATKINTVETKEYVCRGCKSSVGITLKPQDNNTSLKRGTKYKLNVVFDVNDKENTYYYMWSSFLNGNYNNSTECKKVTAGEQYGSFVVDGNRKIVVSVYGDSKCSYKINTVESKNYTCSDCAPLSVNIGNNLPSSQTNGTVIHNSVTFNVFDSSSPTYYYIWRTYNNGNNIYTSDCQKVISGKEYVKDLTIDRDLQVRKGTITVYSDSNCKNRLNSVPIAETTTYTCSNCNETNYSNNSGNSNNNSGSSSNNSNGYNYSNIASNVVSAAANVISNISAAINSNNSTNATTNSSSCTYSCSGYGSGWEKVGDGPSSYCQKHISNSYYCPSGFWEKVGDGPNSYCIDNNACYKLEHDIKTELGVNACRKGKYYNIYTKKCFSKKNSCINSYTEKVKTKKQYATQRIISSCK